MTQIPTGSKWHRMWKCPPSAVLPWDVSDEREERTEPARSRGQTVHRFLETVRASGYDVAIAEAPPDMWPLLKCLDLDALPVHLSTEVAFAYDMFTGAARELGRNLQHRDYAALGVDLTREIPFTLDVIGTQQANGSAELIGYVGDYKTGRTKYPPPDQFGQTLLGALAMRSLFGCERVVLELVLIDEAGVSYPVRRVVDSWDLEVIQQSFLAAWQAIEAAEVEYQAGRQLALHEGNHCLYCGAYKHCDAKVALVRSIPDELVKMGVRPTPEGELEITPGHITVRNAADFYVMAERLREVLGKVQTEICGMGFVAPIPLPDGRVIEPYETTTSILNGKIAAAVLAERYGQEEAMSAIKISVTQEALKTLVVKHMKVGEKQKTRKGDGVVDRVMADIEARPGGVITKTTEACKPHVPKKKPAR